MLDAGRGLERAGRHDRPERHGEQAGTAFKSHKITIGAAGTITATLDWDNASANLRLFLYDPTGALVWQSPTAGKPKTMSFDAPTAGTWKLGVKALSGSAAYTLSVDYPGSGSAGGPATYSGAYGFSGSAGLYAYGMDWDPTDNTILVGDYWNYRVWRYTTDGQLVGSVSRTRWAGSAEASPRPTTSRPTPPISTRAARRRCGWPTRAARGSSSSTTKANGCRRSAR